MKTSKFFKKTAKIVGYTAAGTVAGTVAVGAVFANPVIAAGGVGAIATIATVATAAGAVIGGVAGLAGATCCPSLIR